MLFTGDIPVPKEEEKKEKPAPKPRKAPTGEQLKYVPEKLKGTEFEGTPEDVTFALLERGEQGFDFAVDLDKGRIDKALEIYKGLSPQKAARVQQIAEDHQIPFHIIQDNYEEWDKWKEADDLYKSLLERDNKGRYKYPLTANWLQHPGRMTVWRNDAESLKQLESLMVAYKPLPVQMMRHHTEGLKNIIRSRLQALQDWHEVIGPMSEKIPEKIVDFLPVGKSLLTAERMLGEKGREAVSQTFQTMQKYPALEPARLDAGEGFDRYMNMWASNLPQIEVGLLNSIAFGSPVIGAASMGLGIYGSTLKELEEKGVDKNRARMAALGHAIVESALEYAPFREMMDLFKATGVKETVFAVAKTAIAEAAQEYFQEYSEEIAMIWGEAEKEGHTPEDQLRIFWEKLPETHKRGLYAGSLAIPTALLGGAVRLPYNIIYSEQVEKDVQYWDGMTQIVDNSEGFKAAPQDGGKFLEDTANKIKGHQNFWVSLDDIRTLFQDDPRQVNKFLNDMGIKDQVPEAMTSGKDLEVPIAKFAEKYKGTDLSTRLRESIRFDPRGMNLKEQALMKEEMKEAFEEIQKDYEKNVKENKLPQQFIDMRNKLIASKKEGGFGMKADDADSELKVFLAGATVLSRKGGETLEQWFDRVNPAIKVGGEYVGALTQEGETPRASITFADGKTLINLYQKADMSSFIHESGHLFFNEMGKLVQSGKADPQLVKDYNTLLRFAYKGAQEVPPTIQTQEPTLVSQAAEQAPSFPIDDYTLTSEMYDEISKGEPGGKTFTDTSQEQVSGYTRVKGFTSTYPDYFKGKGYTKKNVLNILQKVLDNKPLTDKQQEIYDDLLDAKKHEVEEKAASRGIALEDLQKEVFKEPERIEGEARTPEGEVDTSFEFGAAKTQFQGIPSDDDIDFEKIAKAFEEYVKEGKAPSRELINSFRRMRNWLSAIYKALRGMDIEIDDEVRGVFDRLLASEEDIKAVQEYYNQRKQIEDFVELDEQKKAELAQKRAKAQESAIDKQVRRYLKAYYKAIGSKKEIKKQATDEINALPVYQAIDEAINKDGLSFNYLVNEYGMDAVQEISKTHKGLISKKGMASLRDLAAKYDFPSESALMEQLMQTRDKKTAIEGRTKEIMDKVESDIREDAAKYEEIAGEESLHTDANLTYQIAQAEILAQQIEKAGKKVQRPRNVTAKAYKDVAESLIADKAVKVATRYDLFAKAEQRLANEAWKALKKGDTETAYQAWQKMILNHALVQAAVRARDTKQRIQKGAKRLGNLKPDRVEYANREAILALIHRYGLGTPRMMPQEPEEVNIAALVESMGDMGFAPSIPDWIIAMQGPENYRDLKYGELIQLYDAMQNIYQIGRKDVRAKFLSDTLRERLDLEGDILIKDLTPYMIEKMSTLKSRHPVDEHHWFSGPQKFGRSLLAELSLANIQVQEFDAYEGMGPKGKAGLNESIFMRSLGHADSESKNIWDTQIASRLEGQGDIIQGLRAINTRLRKQYGKKINPDKIGVPLGADPDVKLRMEQHGMNLWTPERLIMAALNMGNDGNMRALKRGYGWSDEQIETLKGMLTAQDWQTIQKVWDLVNEFYYPMDDVYFRMNGSHTKKVDAVGFDIMTDDGKTVHVKGGYFPLIFDQALSDRAAKNQEEDLMKNRTDAVFQNASTKSGFSISRTGGTLPPKLSINVLYDHLKDTVHYITHAEIIRDLDRITRDRDWKSMVVEKFGVDVHREFREMLRYVARPQRGPLHGIDRLATRWRKLATLYALGYNLKSGLRQTLSLTSAAQEIGWNWTERGVRQLATHPLRLFEDVNEMSSYMKNQAKTMDREIQEQLESIKPFAKKINIHGHDIGIKEVRDTALVFVRGFDKITRYASWSGAYQKFMAENALMPIEQRMVKASAYADDIVAKTQPSARAMDLSHWQRGEGLGRLLNMFMTWTLKYGHRTRAHYRGFREGDISYSRHVFNEQILPMMGATAIGMGWAMALGKWDEDDDDLLKEFSYMGVNQLLSGYPVLREIPGVIKYPWYRQNFLNVPALEPVGRKHGKTVQEFFNLFAGDDPLDEKAMDFAYALALSVEFESGVPAFKVYKDLMKAYEAHIE